MARAVSLLLFVLAAAISLTPAMSSEVSDYAKDYVNPCDVTLIQQLTDRFNDAGVDCQGDGPSYRCSGLFIHGFDCGLGKNVDGDQYWCQTGGFINNDVPGSEPLMKEIMRKPPPYNPSPFSDPATIEDLGYTGNPPTGDVYDMETRDFINSTLSQSVPPYVILDPDDGNNTMTYDGNACPSVPPARPIALEDFPNLYPPQCPTSVSLQLGMISFAYVRADIMPEIYMQRFENSNDRGISNVWPGPGMILQYSDNKFWDDGRVAASYPADAYTLLRGACGVGRGLPELQFLIDPEDLQAMTEETIANVTDGKPVPWCPHDPKSPEDIEAISPSKLDAYCPGWVSDLYQYNAFNEFATRQLLDMGLTERDAREFAMCALDDWRFDDIFIPAATQDKEIDPYTLDTPGVPAYWYYSSDKWNEILIKSWGGVSLKELAKETIMYVLEEDSLESTVQAFKYARWLSDATGIPVPIVEVKNDGFFRIPEFYPGTDIPHPNFSDPLEPFSCAALV